jgi:hypothetical protein
MPSSTMMLALPVAIQPIRAIKASKKTIAPAMTPSILDRMSCIERTQITVMKVVLGRHRVRAQKKLARSQPVAAAFNPRAHSTSGAATIRKL